MALVYLFKFLAVVVFAYLVWRRLHDDLGKDVNAFLWSCLVAFFVGGRVGWSFANLLKWDSNLWGWLFFWDNPGLDILIGVFCLLSFVWLYSMFERWNFVELSEDLLIPTIFGGLWWVGSDWFLNGGAISQLLALRLVLVLVLSCWARRYRSFYWYRSGKKGFLFLFSGLVFCLLTIGISYMVDIWAVYRFLALIFSLIFLTSLVMLGELINLDRKKNEQKK